jgi:CubicO group peptidase (beta-lactamase class C family)
MIRWFAFVFALILPLITTMPASADPSANEVAAIFASLKSENAPGAAVLVIRNGHIAFLRGYGVTDLRTLNKINAQTNFRLASCTKQFTATAVMLLVRDGKLHYDDHLTDIFPEFPAYGKPITVRNLLNHTSGLRDYEDLMPKPRAGTPSDRIPQIHDAGVLKLLEQQTSGKFPPGTKWDYSNSGYAVLAMIVEKVSGEPFGQFLQERIFIPLDMTNTIAYEKGRNEVSHRAYGHSRQRNRWRETDQSSTSAVLGDGGVYSSLEDLEKWDRALVNHTLLSEADMQPALTPVNPPQGQPHHPDGTPAAYGFGWFLNPYHNRKRMWHYGETVGFRTVIERFPDDKLSIIVLCNRADLNPEQLSLKVADLYLGQR